MRRYACVVATWAGLPGQALVSSGAGLVFRGRKQAPGAAFQIEWEEHGLWDKDATAE